MTNTDPDLQRNWPASFRATFRRILSRRRPRLPVSTEFRFLRRPQEIDPRATQPPNPHGPNRSTLGGPARPEPRLKTRLGDVGNACRNSLSEKTADISLRTIFWPATGGPAQTAAHQRCIRAPSEFTGVARNCTVAAETSDRETPAEPIPNDLGIKGVALSRDLAAVECPLSARVSIQAAIAQRGMRTIPNRSQNVVRRRKYGR